MAELGIKSRVELADKMDNKVRPQTIGKWIAKKSKPRGESLMFLAKALKMSADLLLFDEGDNPEQTKSLERMVSSIVKAELKKTTIQVKEGMEKVIAQFFECPDVPEEDRKSILRQIENLLKLYKKS